MKLIGFLMVTVGFILAALASVIDENVVRWLWYIPALGLGVAGVIIVRVNDARQNKTEHHVASRIETVESSLEKITTNINKLNTEKHSINTYDMRHRIDELFVEDLDKFVDARESIAHRYGLAAYGEVMSSFAAGERYLNRVWSASADGYIDEVNAYLEKARDQFVQSLEQIQRLKTSPDVQTSTFS
jgi:coenzyme F420-reducing hydrogenase delta subunit